MSTHRHPRHAQVKQADDWLMTYADTITLLLCLFVVLLALEGSRIHALRNVALPVSADKPNVTGIFQAGIVTPFPGLPEGLQPAVVTADDSDTEPSDPHATPVFATPERPAWEARPSATAISVGPATSAEPVISPVPAASAVPATYAITAVAAVPSASAAVEGRAGTATQRMPSPEIAQGDRPGRNHRIEPNGDRVTILALSSTAFFSSGSAALSDTGKSILATLVGKLESEELGDYGITVEGHTDDEPVSTLQFPTNWELSAARAAAVVRFFVDQGISAQRLRAAGYADTRPLAPNRDARGNAVPENQAKNRRVVIELEKILRSGA